MTLEQFKKYVEENKRERLLTCSGKKQLIDIPPEYQRKISEAIKRGVEGYR